jgi:hypothetical protein
MCNLTRLLHEKVIFYTNTRYMARQTAIVVLLFMCLCVVLLGIFFVVTNTQTQQSPGPSSVPTGTGAAAPGPALSPVSQVAYPMPPHPDIMAVIMSEILPKLAEGIGFAAAMTAILRPNSTINLAQGAVDRLSALKTRFLAKTEFQNSIKPARNASFAAKSFTKRVAQLTADGVITAADAARVGVKFGTNTLADIASAGRRWAQSAGLMTDQLASDATALGASTAEVAGFRAAAATAQEVLGPIAAVYDAFSVVGIILDAKGWGGWTKMAKTDDLLRMKADNDAKQANELFIRNSLNYPFIVGPLDIMRMKYGDAAVEQIIDNEMMKLLCDGLQTGSPNPIVQNILTIFINRQIINPNSDNIDIDLAYAFQQIDSTLFESLYDVALDTLCTTSGGVSFDQGVPGWKKACTFSTKDQCYSNSVWTYQKGVYSAPAPGPSPSPSSSDSPYDGAYFEWRMPNYFSTVPVQLFNDPNTYHVQNVPAAGACIAQDPSFHLDCDEPVGVDGGQFTGGGGYAVNQYNRDTGVCYNDVPAMCDMYGVDQKSDGPRDPMGNQYPSCYISDSTDALMQLAGGQSLYQSQHSCTAGTCVAANCGRCVQMYTQNSLENGKHPVGVWQLGVWPDDITTRVPDHPIGLGGTQCQSC